MLLLRTSRGVDPGIPLLRSLGSNAHVWLPGANGVNVASLPSNNYLLSDGSTGYSTVDGVDGLTLDGMGSLGAELVTNGGFDSATGWTSFLAAASTASISGGVATITQGGGYAFFAQSVLVENKAYQCTLDVVSITGTASLKNSSAFAYATFTSAGQKTFRFRHSVANTNAYLSADSGTVVFDNISVREVSGIHLTQATTANKPVLRRGLWNLSSWSYDTSNAAWAATAATLTPNSSFTGAGLLTGLGTTTAYAKVAPSNSDYGFNNGTAQTIGFRVKAATGSVVGIWSSSTALGANFNLSTASVSGISCAGASMASVGDGSFIICINALKDNIYETSRITLGSGYNASPTTAGVVIGQAFIFLGTLTAAQILAEGGIPTTTATAASNPTSGKYWWSFDGSNDSLLSGNLGITNACTIVIAGRVNSLAATQMLFAETTNGVQVSIATDGSVSFAKVGDAALVATAAGVVVAGVPFVLTARLSAGTADIRKNGAQSATAASATVFAAVTGARIGTAFDGTTSPTGGAIGWVVPLPTALSDADCLTVEQLAAAQFPGMATF